MQPQTTRFLLTQSLFLILSAILLLNFFTVAGAVDLKLITAYIDVNAAFPLRQHWALAELNHRYVKYVLIAVYLSYGIAWLMSFYSEKIQATTLGIWVFLYYGDARNEHNCHFKITIGACLPMGYGSGYNAGNFMGIKCYRRALFPRWTCFKRFCIIGRIFYLSHYTA